MTFPVIYRLWVPRQRGDGWITTDWHWLSGLDDGMSIFDGDDERRDDKER